MTANHSDDLRRTEDTMLVLSFLLFFGLLDIVVFLFWIMSVSGFLTSKICERLTR